MRKRLFVRSVRTLVLGLSLYCGTCVSINNHVTVTVEDGAIDIAPNGLVTPDVVSALVEGVSSMTTTSEP